MDENGLGDPHPFGTARKEAIRAGAAILALVALALTCWGAMGFP